MSYLADRLQELSKDFDEVANKSYCEFATDFESQAPTKCGWLIGTGSTLADTALRAAKELDKMEQIIGMLDEETLLKLDELGLL